MVGDNFSLWHRRMGHPSNKVVSLLHVITSVSSKQDNCDVYFRAKETRSSFELSSNKADEPFQLVHCDL